MGVDLLPWLEMFQKVVLGLFVVLVIVIGIIYWRLK